MVETRIVSWMEKCFLDQKPSDFAEISKLRMYKNERTAFQFLIYDNAKTRVASYLYLTVEGPLKDYVTLKTVENVPNYSSAPFCDEEGNPKQDFLLRTTAGLYPDLLLPLMRKNAVPWYNQQIHSVWVELEGDLPVGNHALRLILADEEGEEKAVEELEVAVMDLALPPQETKVTNWFYADCLADYYETEVFSDRHFEICENFLRAAVRGGVNMILMPVVTPPLDTYVGGERTTCQLVGITRNQGEYSFDFSLVDRWLAMCDRCGVKYIEVCHLFSQWGGEHAPKIMAEVDGTYQQIFGWDTDAGGEEYVTFLRTFLKALTAYLEKRGDKERTYFHISDEPNEKHLAQYRINQETVREVLDGWKVMDALSDVEFYRKGLCQTPVSCTSHIEDFMKEDISERWVYYACSPLDTANRGFAIPSARTRSLGMQMYKYGIDGFLHWGFNFYNNQCSYDHINPFLNPCGGYFRAEIGGDCHLVYPGAEGKPLESLRLEASRQAYEDIRVFRLCESFYGKERVVEEIERITGEIDFFRCVNDVATMQRLRDRMDDLILDAAKKGNGL